MGREGGEVADLRGRRSPGESEKRMPLFVVEYTFSPETSSGRDDHRTDHHGWLAELVRRKVVLSSHPFAEGHGARFVVDAADAETVTRLFTHDPFARANLVETVRVREWDSAIFEFTA